MSSCRSSGIFQSFLQVLWLGGGLKLFGTRLKIPPLASVSHQRLWVLRPQLWKSYTDMLNIACCQFSQRNQGSFIGICKPLQQTSPRCGPGKLWSNWLCQGHGKPGWRLWLQLPPPREQAGYLLWSPLLGFRCLSTSAVSSNMLPTLSELLEMDTFHMVCSLSPSNSFLIAIAAPSLVPLRWGRNIVFCIYCEKCWAGSALQDWGLHVYQKSPLMQL